MSSSTKSALSSSCKFAVSPDDWRLKLFLNADPDAGLEADLDGSLLLPLELTVVAFWTASLVPLADRPERLLDSDDGAGSPPSNVRAGAGERPRDEAFSDAEFAEFGLSALGSTTED